GNIVTLFLFYPVAHLILVRAGCRLLSANFIPVVPAAENTSRPSVSSLTVSPVANQSQFFDKNATVDKRVFACVNRNEVEIITGWLTENNNRKENMVVLYNRNRNLVQLIGGPWLTGHWGHETYGAEVSLDDAFSGIYPRGFYVKDEYVELIKQYLLKNVKKTPIHTGLSV
ncbi:MAG: hypothetical protein U9N63_14065, partial [Pseudomonadota bacterium]|nr:hypothetical protein [Pseudomonadota bacterium]